MNVRPWACLVALATVIATAALGQTPRSPISSSLAPARDSFGAYAARARRLLGTGLSIL